MGRGVHVQWPWSWLEPIFMSVCLSRMKWCGGGTERENANVVFSVLFKARSIAKSWAIWDCHHPHDVKFNSCVAIVHLFMYCIYLTSGFHSSIFYFEGVLYLSENKARKLRKNQKEKSTRSVGSSNGWTTYSILHRTVQLLEKWRS